MRGILTLKASYRITDVKARKIFNSRGEETIEVDIRCGGFLGRSSAPSGKSRGIHEAIPYPNGGVDGAIIKVKNLVKPKLKNFTASNQKLIDQRLHEIDGSLKRALI